MLICGIDEAGRGPVIGPLVMAGVLIKEEDEEKLRNIGVKDSKLLTKQQRNDLYKKIIKTVKTRKNQRFFVSQKSPISVKYKIIITEPKEIDKAVKGKNNLNLNWLEADKSAEIINTLKPEKAIVDCPSNNLSKYKNYLFKKIKIKDINLILEHKADLNHPVVAAASIIAKVTRDNEIEKIKRKIKVNFGSGYPSDPITKEFLEKNHDKYPKIFRKSWSSYSVLKNKKNQKKLFDFK